VVAPRVGGIPELVDDGRTGLLFEPRNPLDLANALGRMLSDPVGARAMGQAGRERVITEFSLERMVRDTEEELLRIYAETVSPPE
jgi:starch synthase